MGKKRHQATRHITSQNRRPRLGGYIGLKHVALFALSVGSLGLAFGAGLALKPADTDTKTPLASLSHDAEAPSSVELIKLINTARADNKLPAVGTDYRLNATAQERLHDMATHQYYAHQNLAGTYYYDLLKGQGITGYSCENLSLSSSIDAQAHVDSWLASTEGHRECLLNNQTTKVGIASGLFSSNTPGTDPTYLVVTIYASPPD